MMKRQISFLDTWTSKWSEKYPSPKASRNHLKICPKLCEPPPLFLWASLMKFLKKLVILVCSEISPSS